MNGFAKSMNRLPLALVLGRSEKMPLLKCLLMHNGAERAIEMSRESEEDGIIHFCWAVDFDHFTSHKKVSSSYALEMLNLMKDVPLFFSFSSLSLL